MVNSSVVFSEEPFLTTQRSNYSLAISSHQISDLFIQQTFFFFLKSYHMQDTLLIAEDATMRRTNTNP